MLTKRKIKNNLLWIVFIAFVILAVASYSE